MTATNQLAVRGDIPPEVVTRFYAKVAVAAPEDCWRWSGNIMRNGYGQGDVGLGSNLRVAHRISYYIHNGELVAGMEIDHTCRNRACVNPRHLEQVTPALNDFRRRRTHCKRGHDYAVTGAYAAYRPNGSLKYRNCRQCMLDRARNHPKVAVPA